MSIQRPEDPHETERTQTFPDDQYGVWVQLYTGNPAQVHAVPLLATKTAAGISVSVAAASAVGNVGVDVLAVRT